MIYLVPVAGKDEDGGWKHVGEKHVGQEPCWEAVVDPS